jgi:hypothetical protein
VNTPVVTDVFKFLAVRPAQRVTDKETELTVIRDARAGTPLGDRELVAVGRSMSPPGAALAQWDKLDLSALEPLAQGHRELKRKYEQADPQKPPPDPKAALKEAGLAHVKDGSDPKLIGKSWEALYTAHATGADAGPRVETAMAALRVLHFAQTLAKQPSPSTSAALQALNATVAVAPVFEDSLRTVALTKQPDGRATPPTAGTTIRSADAVQRSEQIRSLATDLDVTSRLLQAVVEAPAIEDVGTSVTSIGRTTGWSSKVNVTTTPSLRQALPAQFSRQDAAVLDHLRIAETTPAPAAAQALQRHYQKLTDRAAAFADDPEFRRVLMGASFSEPERLAKSVKTPEAPDGAPDVDVSGRITPLGIGDLKVVKQTLTAYVAGEVAHIENVLKGESKDRTHRKLDRTETTIFASEEETNDTQRDTQSTERFELKREAEQTIKEDMSIKAGLTVTGSYGPVVATATGEFAYSTSKQESQKNSTNFAREVVDRSVTKVQTKKRLERTTKTLNEVEEINKHSLNNGPPSAAHVTGIYRWVDKRYRAQVHNYGARLLLEFVVPEPAAFYRATHAKATKISATPPPAFETDPVVGTGPMGFPLVLTSPLTATDINEFNYLRYAARYGTAGIAAPPPLFNYIGVTLAKEEIAAGSDFAIATKELVVPAGYKLASYSAAVSLVMAEYPQFNLQVRGDVWVVRETLGGGGRDMHRLQLGDVAGNNVSISGAAAVSVPVSIACYDVFAFAVNVQGVCVRTGEALTAWQLDTFTKIQTAYQALRTAYDQKLTQAEAAAGIAIEGRNPAANRIIEKQELKKLCITMMTGQHYNQFGAMTEPANDPAHPPEVDVFEALDEGPIIQFFEQAFEWDQMTYLYYPYFWGRKKNWLTTVNLTDPDPLFQQFLTAGAARVLVPVPLAYIDSVQFLLQNPLKETELRKKVWRGGERPTLDDKDGLYVSIAEELRNRTDDLAGAIPEGDPWEFTLPTTLVWLQPDDKLPTFP